MSEKRRVVALVAAAVLLVGLLGACAGPALGAGATASDETALAQQILDATGIRGGLIVHLGCGDGKRTAALGAGDGYLVHGLDADAGNVERARAHVRSLGLYGKVSIERWTGERLPYVDNLVTLVVADEVGPGAPAAAEVMRVLAPGGVAYLGGRKTVKPRPEQIDDWTHYLHDATGNAVAHDTVVGPPRHLQWVGSPKWARHHDHMASLSAMVSAGGRLFYIFDEGSTASLQMPSRWRLVARDAFNGVVLWKRPITSWWPHLWPLKSGPAFLPRRLVADGDRVYATLGLPAPLTALDAVTGRTVRTYEGTDATEEIIASDGVLFVLVNPKAEADTYDSVDQLRRAVGTWQWDGAPRRILALRADTGARLWGAERRVVPLTLAADAKRVFFHDGRRVVCLDRKTGGEVWQSEPIPRWATIRTWSAPTLVVHNGVVVFAGAEKMTRHRGGRDTMTALSADTGKTLWKADHPTSGYDSPEDVFIVDGLVWTAPMTNRGDSGRFTGRDLATGEVKVQFPADDGQHMPHHRCHRAKATDRFILASRTGIEFVDLAARHWNRHDWVRGSCLYGIIPANGLVYAPPHSCACYIVAKLYGLNALAGAAARSPAPKAAGPRLEKGPAFAEISNPKSQTSNRKSEISDLKSEISDRKSETSNRKPEISDRKSETSNPKSEISNRKSQTSNPESEISNRKSETSNPKSEISNRKSEISDRKSETSNRNSEISDRKSETSNLKSEISDRKSEISNLKSQISDRKSETSNRKSEISRADWPTYRHDAARSGHTAAAVPAALKEAWQTKLGGKLTSIVIAEGRVFVAQVDAHTVHCLGADGGKPLWSYTTGGRVDSPPTIHAGLALFGSADGHVYCLRASDGALVWRFRAAPHDQRLVAFEQVESVRPVHGSVLVTGGAVHCVAGRSMFLDGGLRYLRLDPRTGKMLSETVLDDRHPETGKKLDAGVRWPNLPVALPDVLSCDGRNIYMRSQPFDLTGRRRGIVTPANFRDQTGETAHLFSPTGFLDDTWWHRSYWMYGKTPVSAAGGWYLAGWRAPAGRIMVFDDANVYAFGRHPRHFPATTWIEYQLFSASKAPEIVGLQKKPPAKLSDREKAQRKRRGAPTHPAYRWSHTVPMLARAMVLAGRTLFVAGPPDLVNEQQASAALRDARFRAKVAAQDEALRGGKGGLLLAVSAADGKPLAEYRLDAPPVFDGLAAAGERLYLATTDGKVICFGEK